MILSYPPHLHKSTSISKITQKRTVSIFKTTHFLLSPFFTTFTLVFKGTLSLWLQAMSVDDIKLEFVTFSDLLLKVDMRNYTM